MLQTLDKKIMSDLKLRKFSKLRQKQLFASEWTSTTPETTSSADSVVNDDDNLNLVTGGSCGAFIHGLEDEFLEVRGESVDALCSLAIACPKLAAKSIDFLVDMFNDEIETVRLKAIIALTRITHYVLLGDDQIDIVLSVIEVLNAIYLKLFLKVYVNFILHHYNYNQLPNTPIVITNGVKIELSLKFLRKNKNWVFRFRFGFRTPKPKSKNLKNLGSGV